jgi:hypothetical protein
MTDLPKQAAIANEIKTALSNGAKLTSAELCAKSHTALDSTDISRVIGDLKAAGLVAQFGTKKSTATGGTSKAWAWIGPPDAAVPKSTARGKAPKESIEDEAPAAEVAQKFVTGLENTAEELAASTIEVPCGGWHPLDYEQGVDPIEMALAELVAQTDESILSFAAAMLSDHPTWVRLRQMQDDAFQLLCDYRLTKTLGAK